MDLEAVNERRAPLNRRLADADEFFGAFGELEHDVAAGETVEAVKLGVLAAGSVAYPTARNAFDVIERVLS